jgi:TolB-like protein/tetratricopeptide (TPR) repeat protein
MSLIAELRRRNVIRMAGLYLVGAWLLTQVATTVLPLFDVPGWALRTLVVALALGFVPALIFAWVFELTPQGLTRDEDVKPGESIAAQTARRMDRLIIVLLILALVYFVFDKFVLAPGREAAAQQQKSEELAEARRQGGVEALVQSYGDKSIAVLPFADMSQAHDQEYFSEGMSEELLNLLTQVPGLHVAGRTSARSFKGKDTPVAAIGKALNVSALLQGSVRKAGDRLRVTVQLVNVADGFQIWSQTYDRKEADIFAVQDDIAGAVVDALKMKLLPGLRPSSRKHHVPSFETYDQYLLGRKMLSSGAEGSMGAALKAFSLAVKIDPNYPQGFAALAMVESFVAEANSDATAAAQGFRRAMAAAEQAVALDPELGDAYAARGYVRGTNYWDWSGAMADLAKAISLDPADARNQLRYGYQLATLGRLSEATIALEKSTQQDPLFVPAWHQLGLIKAAQGDYEGARTAMNRVLTITPGQRNATMYLGMLSLLQGDAAAARSVFVQLKSNFGRALAEHDLGNYAEAKRALDQLIDVNAKDVPFVIASVYAWSEDRDQAFAWLDRAVAQHDSGIVALKYDPLLRGLRDDARYAALLKKLKLPEK